MPGLPNAEVVEEVVTVKDGDIVLTPEQALNALTEEQKRNLAYIAQLETANSSLKNTVNQLENQLATGEDSLS